MGTATILVVLAGSYRGPRGQAGALAWRQRRARRSLDWLSPAAGCLALSLARDVSGLWGTMLSHALDFFTIEAFWEDV